MPRRAGFGKQSATDFVYREVMRYARGLARFAPLRFVSPNLFGGWMTVPMLLAPTPALLTGPFSSPGERKADESHVNTLFSAFTSRPSYMLSAKRLDPS
jgi:hypothetical protein